MLHDVYKKTILLLECWKKIHERQDDLMAKIDEILNAVSSLRDSVEKAVLKIDELKRAETKEEQLASVLDGVSAATARLDSAVSS